MSVMLKPGDLVWWEDGERSAPILVGDNGVDMWFEFAPKPWHIQDLRWGKTVTEVENILNGRAEWTGPGHLYKSYDAELDTSYGDPRAS